MSDHTGRQLGNYRLTRLLGQGGFADVYLGEHIYLKTLAAIKVLHTQLTQDMMGNFLGEAQIIAQLTHPHIVRVLDFGVENTTPFLVMEYAPHGTLRQRHPRGANLPLPLIVSYVKQVAGALQYAHDRRLVHRDVKPENMLLGRENEVLLSDFGIATITPNSRSLQTQNISGTILYMAPEQIQGKSRPASDDDTVQIWDTMNGKRYVNYTGHSGFVVAMAWSPDGQYIASGGVDTTVQVWKVADGTLIFKYTGHNAEVECVTWSPDSKHVASASDDQTVQLWQVS